MLQSGYNEITNGGSMGLMAEIAQVRRGIDQGKVSEILFPGKSSLNKLGPGPVTQPAKKGQAASEPKYQAYPVRAPERIKA